MSASRSAGRTLLAVLGLAVLVLAVLNLACGGGGGGGGGGGTPPTQPNASLTFTQAGGGGNGSIVLERANVGATTLVLDLRVTGVTDLYGVAFDLSFPSNLLQFVSPATEGPFLSQGGSSTSLLVDENPTGNLVVGLSRLGATPGQTGSGVLLTLTFTAIGSGSGTIQFVAPQALNSNGAVIGGLAFEGGTVTVQL